MKKIIIFILIITLLTPSISKAYIVSTNSPVQKQSFWYKLGNKIESILNFGRIKKKENPVSVNQQNNFNSSQLNGLNTLPVNQLNTLPLSETKSTASKSKPKTKVVEVQEVPVQEPTIYPNPQTTQTNPQLLQVAKKMLDTDDQGILLIKNTYQTKYDNALRGQELCNSKYNNNTAKAKSDAEYLKTSYLENRSGFATNTSQLKEIEDALAYDLETYRIQKESCLSSYKLPNSSILSKLNQLSEKVSSLRSRINTPDDAVKYQNELKSLGDEILSVAGLVGSN